MQFYVCFSFYCYYSQPSEMGLEKIQETTNQLSLVLALPGSNILLHFYMRESQRGVPERGGGEVCL